MTEKTQPQPKVFVEFEGLSTLHADFLRREQPVIRFYADNLHNPWMIRLDAPPTHRFFGGQFPSLAEGIDSVFDQILESIQQGEEHGRRYGAYLIAPR